MIKRWAIFIPGADEYHVAPSEEAAIYMAARHTAAIKEYVATNGLAWATETIDARVVEWPFDPESHADELKEFDYAAWDLGGTTA